MKKNLLLYSLPICARLGVLSSRIGSLVRSIDNEAELLNYAEENITRLFQSEVALLRKYPDVVKVSPNADFIKNMVVFAGEHYDDKKFEESLLVELVNEFCGLSVALQLMNDDYFGGDTDVENFD